MNDRKQVSIAVGLFVLFAAVTVTLADSIVVDVVQTPGIGTAYSDPIRASGTLDRIELVRKGTGTATNQNTAVVIATYDGTTALTTYATVTFATTELTKTVRPRVIGQTTAGVNLAAASALGGANTNTTQMLVAAYEPMFLGGNIKMAVTTDATNDAVRAVLYFKR